MGASRAALLGGAPARPLASAAAAISPSVWAGYHPVGTLHSMRALLVVNPAATTTSARTRDVLIHALASEMKLEAVTTEYRGHARDLGRQAAQSDDVELVVALGGDGTVNEVVNGLLHAGPDPERLPRLAVVPGGSTNVFARALGLPNHAVEATGALLDALRDGSERTVGLGLASGTPGTEDEAVPSRWFTFNAGLGFDAGVVGRVEQHRERGKKSTHALYVRQVMRALIGEPHRRNGTITLERAGEDPVTDLVLSIVSNTCPWTFLGNRPIYARPRPRSTPRSTSSASAACRRPRLPGMAPSCSLRPPSAGPVAGTPSPCTT